MNTNKSATRSVNRKLLAALAVLAVALVALAAIPAVADTDSDAAGTDVYVSQNGTATMASSTAASPAAFSALFESNALKQAYSGYTIHVVGAVTAAPATGNALTTLTIGYPVTFTGQAAADGTAASINGYQFKITATTGTVAFKNIALTNKLVSGYATLATGNGSIICTPPGTSSGFTAVTATLSLQNVNVTINSGTSEVSDVKAVQYYGENVNTGAIEVSNSTFAFVGQYATDGKASAIYLNNNASVAINGSTFTGFNRPIQLDAGQQTRAVVSIGATARNTYVMSNEGADGKVINIGTGSATAAYTSITVADTDSSVQGGYAGALLATSSSSSFTGKLTTSMSITVNSTTGITLNGAELRNGADLVIPSGAKVTLANNSTLTIGSGSAVKVAGILKYADDVTESTQAKIVNNGKIAVLEGASMLTLPTNVKSVAAYEVSYSAETANATSGASGTSILSGPTLVYAGEKIEIVATPVAGYAVSKVFLNYTITTDKSIAAAYDDAKGIYSVTVPATTGTQALTNLSVSNVTSGACTVAYVPVDAQGNILPGTQYVQGLVPEASIASGATGAAEANAPELVSAGYVFSGTWSNTATGTGAVTWEAVTAGDNIYYGLMEKAYAITIGNISNGSAETAPADYAKKDAIVTVTTSAASGYKLADVKVVDASGKAVKAEPISVGSAIWKFTMPASAVTVTAEFKEIHTVTAPKFATTTEPGVWTVAEGETNSATAAGVGKYVQGDEVTVSVAITGNYGVKTFAIVGASGNVSYESATVVGAAFAVTFVMPNEDVTLSYTYGPANEISCTFSNVEITANGSDVEPGTTLVAAGATVIVKVTPSTTTDVVKSFAVVDEDNAVVTYVRGATTFSSSTGYTTTFTFVMPETAATVTIEDATAVKVVSVTQAGAGNVIGPNNGYVAFEGEVLSYTVNAADRNALKQITVTKHVSTANPYYFVYDVATGKLTEYTYSGTAYSGSEVTDSWIAASTAGFTIEMQDFDADIAFEFETVNYYTITLPDDGSDVKIYETYKKGKLSDIVDTSVEVPAKTYYIVVSQIEGKDVQVASATYTHDGKVTSAPGAATVTYDHRAGDKIYITLISQSAEQAIYMLDLTADTTISAGYTDHYSVISIASGITDGKLALNDGTKNITTPAKVKYGTVLTLVFTDVTAGYVVNTVSPSDVVYADGKYTYTVGMEDATIGVTFGPGFSIKAENPAGITIDVQDEAVTGNVVTVTYTVADGYKLKGDLTAAYGAASVPVEMTKVEGKNAYTFTMPAGDVIVTAESEATGEQPVPATQVTVSIVMMDGVPNVQIYGINGYVPAGTVKVSAFAASAIGTLPVSITLTISEDDVNTSSQIAFVPITSSSANASAIFAGIASYASADGTIPATVSGMTAITQGTVVAATQE